MRRRDFVRLSAGATALGLLGGCAAAPSTHDVPSRSSARLKPADIYIPGYEPHRAAYRGKRALDHAHMTRALPRGYDGPTTLLTRFRTDGQVRQAVLPVRGHDVAISPNKKIGVFGAMEGDRYLTFDAQSLDVVTRGDPFAEGWIGGGHAAFLSDSVLALSERAPKQPYSGQPQDHFGRITLRDPKTLKMIGDISTHGISPHEVRVLADGVNVAIANYGSTVPPGGRSYGVPRHIVEASVTIVDLKTGQLVEKYRGDNRRELRHLCAKDAETIFAIQTEMAPAGADRRFHARNGRAYEAHPNGSGDESFLVAPTLRANASQKRLERLGNHKTRKLMREGLSIEYEPVFNEVIASYPSTNTLLIFDADTGEIKNATDTAAQGLMRPCGVSMLPGQDFYVVAGYWQNLYVYERGTHRLRHELSHHPINFGHSHMVAV